MQSEARNGHKFCAEFGEAAFPVLNITIAKRIR
jgi:hypothetical protein